MTVHRAQTPAPRPVCKSASGTDRTPPELPELVYREFVLRIWITFFKCWRKNLNGGKTLDILMCTSDEEPNFYFNMGLFCTNIKYFGNLVIFLIWSRCLRFWNIKYDTIKLTFWFQHFSLKLKNFNFQACSFLQKKILSTNVKFSSKMNKLRSRSSKWKEPTCFCNLRNEFFKRCSIAMQ